MKMLSAQTKFRDHGRGAVATGGVLRLLAHRGRPCRADDGTQRRYRLRHRQPGTVQASAGAPHVPGDRRRGEGHRRGRAGRPGLHRDPSGREDKEVLVDERSRHNCFTLLPRGLHITWSEDPQYWTWQPLKDGDETETEAAALRNVCWLEVIGKQELSHLTPGVTYEAVLEAMLTDPAYGWSTPVNLRLKLPDGTTQEHKESLEGKPRGQWLRLKVGEVTPRKGQSGEAEVSLFEYEGGQWKRGLLVKGIKIVPKE